MTDKEFKRLGRAQLIDVIYQLQLQIDNLNEEKHKLESKLADKRFRLSNVGSIAEAALEINDCFCNAQKAADQYLNEIKTIREETELQRKRILAQAQATAEAILANAQKTRGEYDSAVETILNEYEQSHSDNG